MEFDGTVAINYTTTEQSIKDAIIDVLGNAVVVTNVEVVVDTSGHVTSVVVDVVGDDEAVRSVVDIVEAHAHKDDCGGDVLCRVAKVTLQTIGAVALFAPSNDTDSRAAPAFCCCSVCSYPLTTYTKN